MPTAADGTKKRKPPTFRHLPVDRAKKLKRSWVEVQKIKSQWKAQRRKEGLVTKGEQLKQLDVDANKRETSADEHDDDARSSGEGDSASSSGNMTDSGEQEDESPRAGPSRGMRPPLAKKRKDVSEETPEGKSTLRDFKRMAYSRATLHTHKSDPLHRRKDSQSARGRGGPSQSRGRGRGGDTPGRGRGRGQPDMRLRMNAMLEKIKRDFA